MRDRITLLLAEDEPALGQIVKESLETRDFDVLLCEDGETALNIYKKEQPELLILDVMMPKKDGFTLAEEIREHDDAIPIIFLTAKSQTKDVLEGFSIGGNDYLKKPFSIEELIARIHNLLNRKDLQKKPTNYHIGDYEFMFHKQTLQYKNDPLIKLTHREAHLLFHLHQQKNEVLDRTYILKKLWGSDDFFNARSMDVFITKLRKKLKKDISIQIVNVRGFGYKLIC